MTTARAAKISVRNRVENVAPFCFRRDLAVVATIRYICSFLRSPSQIFSFTDSFKDNEIISFKSCATSANRG